MRRREVYALAALAALAGCQAPTSLFVAVSDGDGAAPSALLVSLYDVHHALLLRSRVAMPTLPGALEFHGLPALAQPLRLVLAGESSPAPLAGVAVTTMAHARTRVTATLALATPDRDGDGVPDAVDNCVTLANADQLDTVGNGTGDACRGVVADFAVPLDLAADLSPPPDLANVASKCAGVIGTLCDGFESGMAAFWTPTQANGTLTVDTAHAYRGTHALKVHTDALLSPLISSDVRLHESQTLTAGLFPTDLHVRAFLYLPSTFPNSVQFLSAVQSASPYRGVGFMMDKSGDATTNDSVAGGSYVVSTKALPLGRWFCVQWHVHFAPDLAGYMRVFLDGVEVPALKTAEPTESLPPESEVGVGAGFYQPLVANPANDLWIDEVMIGTSQILCTD
jgi:hypothetical protein